MKNTLLLLLLTTSTLLAFTFPPKEEENGKKLFMANCSMCHGKDRAIVGPSLQNIRQDYGINWTVNFIHNPKQMIDANDTQAVFGYWLYQRTEMQAFPELSETEIVAILDYLDNLPINEAAIKHRKLTKQVQGIYLQQMQSPGAGMQTEQLRDSLSGL